MSKNYDAIIIGSGVGGVAIGSMLTHGGWKVLLLERNKKIGGRCISYQKEGFKVDMGNHLFGVGDNGHLGEVLRQVGEADALEWVTIKNPRMQIGKTVKRYSMKTMMELVPEGESGNLQNIFTAALEMPKEEIETLWYVPLSDWVKGFSQNTHTIKMVESISSLYFAISIETTSTGEFIKCWQEVVKNRSSAYPRGGVVKIPEALAKAYEKYGGELITDARVKEIVVENGAAVGVKMKDGSSLFAPVIISNADIKHTVTDLVGEVHFPPEYVRKIKNLEWTYPLISLKVGLKKKITDDQLVMYMPDHFYPVLSLPENEKAGEVPDVVGGMFVSPSNYDPSLVPAGHQLISFGTACTAGQDWKKWEKTLLNSYYEVYPEVKSEMLWHRLDTVDYVDAVAMEGGNCVGVAQTVDQVHERRPSVVSPLKGLYFSSGEAGGHGIGTELAANSAQELFAVLADGK